MPDLLDGSPANGSILSIGIEDAKHRFPSLVVMREIDWRRFREASPIDISEDGTVDTIERDLSRVRPSRQAYFESQVVELLLVRQPLPFFVADKPAVLPGWSEREKKCINRDSTEE